MRIANGEELDDGVDEPDAYDWRDRHDSYHKHLYVDAPPNVQAMASADEKTPPKETTL
jgi:hypothetical protein